MSRDAFDAQVARGLRYDPTTHRWKQVGARMDEVARAEVAPKGPSGKAWDDPNMTRGEFISDYRARYPSTKLDDAALGRKYDDGMRLNPDTGRMRRPQYSNDEIRAWYLKQNGSIEELNKQWVAQGLSAEERARRAYEIRHGARVRARAMMQDRAQVRDLNARDMQKYGNPDGPTFEQLVKQAEAKGNTGDARYEAIVGSSQRTDAATNARFGLQGKDSVSGGPAPGSGATHAGDHAGGHGGHHHDPEHVIHEAWEGAEGPVKALHAEHAVVEVVGHGHGGGHEDEHHEPDHGEGHGQAHDDEHAEDKDGGHH